MKLASELVVSGTDKEGAALAQTRDGLARDIVIADKSTAVGIAFEGVVVEFREHLVHVNGYAEQLLILTEQVNPCVEVGGAVVAVYHSHE